MSALQVRWIPCITKLWTNN